MLNSYSQISNPPAGLIGFPHLVLREANLLFGPNESSINRGDREETGDNEARPTEKGSGDAEPTVDDSAMGGGSSRRRPAGSSFDLEAERTEMDGIEIMEADDGRLGLTNTDRVPADDWAADTGDTAVPDGER